ncbi:type I-G CRISPR-associated helicase/endonuclease Cas3g [Flaviflexus equikiangi]|uniref:Type I-U CRISPR-associated helicase/endonuclease Cas3 n=1 Tax=Flaviflexus equikiangi TaxID=2758573 RepID=A0ABS2TGZ2_9ACTO|nr:type I-U CRISPR-associated helicase/endonuclease Cas3 [Flaviflexus equikiangi]MBM9433925.1 type I-U CRISPR-associated helicase/endonuclease Cas3 [Flaviflexus equikiangi]
MLRPEDFVAFFQELHQGAEPYSWQLGILDDLLETGRWPESITAPTGSGKSAVVDIHVFARALAIQDGLEVPRRLVLVVGRRALVDSQAEHARAIQRILSAPEKSAVTEEVSKLLMRDSIGFGQPLGVSVIRGGLTLDRGWIDHPALTQVLCMTPDMFGSRLLHHGYGEARAARPRSAGLLAFDTAVIIDEAHLNIQLAKTVRRVREIVAESPVAHTVAPLQVVETTATPQPGTPPGVAVQESTLDLSSPSDEQLLQRLRANKSLSVVGLESWPLPRSGVARKQGIAAIADCAVEIRGRVGGTVGVVLNRVADAVSIADYLKRAGHSVVLRVGPMQPLMAMRVAARHPSLLTPEGDADVAFLVATQTIEVGVDLDLHGMVTECASAPALVQRFGRVNRRGYLSHAEIAVVGPLEGSGDLTNVWPYTELEIREAIGWISDVARRSLDLSPSSIMQTRVPPSSRRRLIYERLSLADSELLSHTSEDVFADPELDVWLDDQMGEIDRNVGVIGRRMPALNENHLPFLNATPPQEHEVFPTTMARLREGFVYAAKHTERHGDGRPKDYASVAYIFRDSEWIPWSDERMRLRPGDVACFASTLELVHEGVFLPGIGKEQLGDWLESWVKYPDLRSVLPWPRQRVLQQSSIRDEDASRASMDTIGDALLFQISQIVKDGEELSILNVQDRMSRAGFGEWLQLLMCGSESVEDKTVRFETAPPSVDGHVEWVVFTWESADNLEGESRQEWTLSGRVLLDNHQKDVEDRTGELTRTIGLDRDLARSIALAARHHDDGKKHPLFQKRLGNLLEDAEPLAKSGRRRSLARSRTGSDGLPQGWRHEQFSVLLNAESEWHDKDLILRLIGTSHGHGRAMFDQSTGQLCTAIDDEALRSVADRLFVRGNWDELMERTGLEHRWWGVSYLEAILRAADCQVSKEGR